MSVLIKKLLFATDLSPNSYFTFKYAVMLAKLSGAEIHMLHVVEPLSEDAIVTLRLFIQDDDVRKKALENRTAPAKEKFKQLTDKFWGELPEEDRSVRDQVVSTEFVEGHVADQILTRAETKNCDLIVLGTHEHGMTHTYLGTTAKRVLRRARIPTLVVPFRP